LLTRERERERKHYVEVLVVVGRTPPPPLFPLLLHSVARDGRYEIKYEEAKLAQFETHRYKPLPKPSTTIPSSTQNPFRPFF